MKARAGSDGVAAFVDPTESLEVPRRENVVATAAAPMLPQRSALGRRNKQVKLLTT